MCEAPHRERFWKNKFVEAFKRVTVTFWKLDENLSTTRRHVWIADTVDDNNKPQEGNKMGIKQTQSAAIKFSKLMWALNKQNT